MRNEMLDGILEEIRTRDQAAYKEIMAQRLFPDIAERNLARSRVRIREAMIAELCERLEAQ